MLKERIASQGRRFDWIADRLGVSKSFLSKVVAGQKTIAEADARVIVALVDGELDGLFELPEAAPTNAAASNVAETVP